MSRARLSFTALAVAIGLSATISTGCSPSSGGNVDAGTKDATSGVDAGIDSGVDSGIDSGADSGIDSGADSGIDGGVDSGIDSGADSGIDTGVDSGIDSGADSGIDSGADSGSGEGGGDAAVCTPGTQQCSGTGVETCGANGQWGTPWSCATGTCTGGACTGSTTTGPSCSPGGAGMTNCGASSDSCCTSLEAAGGTYYRTYDPVDSDGGATLAADGGPTGEFDPATVSGFRLDKYEVTVGRFRQYVSAWNNGAGYAPPAASGKHSHLNGGQGLANSGSAGTYEPGWVTSDNGNVSPTNANLTTGVCDPTYATWTSSAGSKENFPIVCVNWWEAYAFCIWDGGFLPSEAEWENAAAGGSQQLEYPWGSTDPGATNQYAIYNPTYPAGGPIPVAVGTPTLGVGRWGQLDLAGNVDEWNLDVSAGYVDPCTDCYDLAGASNRVVRGGNSTGPLRTLLPAYTSNAAPSFRYIASGFRCARTP